MHAFTSKVILPQTVLSLLVEIHFYFFSSGPW